MKEDFSIILLPLANNVNHSSSVTLSLFIDKTYSRLRVKYTNIHVEHFGSMTFISYYILSIHVALSTRNCERMYDCTVSSMSILCLWNIQLTFDWVGIEPHVAHSC